MIQKMPAPIQRIVLLSILLLFFAVPHTLEDFATGEPAEAGVPAAVLALVVSAVLAGQAAGLYWLGRGERRGILAHLGVGLFWPVAAGVAQLPSVVSAEPYRSGFISEAYVWGILTVGVLLFASALIALRSSRNV
jgi:hypothetical protein